MEQLKDHPLSNMNSISRSRLGRGMAVMAVALSLAAIGKPFSGNASAQEQPASDVPVPTETSENDGGEVNTKYKCLGKTATIVGTKNSDRIKGTKGKDVIVALGGDDTIYGYGGNDLICGNNGDDVIKGNNGNDRISGGAGFDTLYGGSGNDKVDGDAGSDLVRGGSGRDSLYGGSGNDEIEGDNGRDRAWGQSGSDWCKEAERQSGCERIRSLKRVAGTSKKAGKGRLFTYNVNIERGIAIDGKAVAEEIDEILADRKGWIRGGRVSFKRVSSGAGTHIILATPAKVDALCYPLNTAGKVSCRQGNRVILNLDRWRYAVRHWPKSNNGRGRDVKSYRSYLANHEMGHRIGKGHAYCSGRGNKAPVMQQQTKYLSGCKANGWPLRWELR